MQASDDEQCMGPLVLVRDLSGEFKSRGASAYDESVLTIWQEHRNAADEALKSKDAKAAIAALEQALILRPDWAQGFLALHTVLMRNGEGGAAQAVLLKGFSESIKRVQVVLSSGPDPTPEVRVAQSFLEKMAKSGDDAGCRVCGVQTIDEQGSELLLYKDDISGETLLNSKATPVRLLFLDVDGVLNKSGSKECGDLHCEPFARLMRVLHESGCSVVLSTSWRSFDELRPLILGVLPAGSVVGQTRKGFENHTRPREIQAFLEIPEVAAAVSQEGAEWAVADDMDLVAMAAADTTLKKQFRSSLASRFVRTDKTLGLQDGDAAQLVQILQ